jgi:hypothetical protein
VFVFAHGNKDGISQLSDSCNRTISAQPQQPGKHLYQFPEARFTPSDWPTVYALAVSGPEAKRQLHQLLQDLPDACSDVAGLRIDTPGQEQWLDRLDRFVASNRDHAVWTARRIP